MKIIDVMRPCNEVKSVKNGIYAESFVHSIRIENLSSNDSVINVLNKHGEKIGEVDKALLMYLISTADTYVIDNILDKFEEAVIAIDCQGKIFYANNAYSKILGVPIRKIIGKQMQKVEPEAEIMNVLKTRIPVSRNKQYIKSLKKYVSVRIYPIEHNKELKAVISIFTDSTEIVKLNEEIKRVNEVVKDFKEQADAQKELTKLKIVGKSPAFVKAISQALVVAKTEASVLIRGENGVGKELFAKIIQSNSKRKDSPMITVNCAAIPENLIESELFGYEEGSFTGAKHGGKMGKFQLANGGTLFLDEIGDMPVTMQSKLLRVLQEGEIEKIGRQKNIPVDVRLVTATNQPLEKMIEEKKFRQDLYYRLNIVEINVPPLRERGEDIGLLANYFLQKYNKKYERDISFSQEVLSILHSYSWPGNVRELQNCIEYSVIMCLEKCLNGTHLPPHMVKTHVKSNEVENNFEYNYGTLKEAVEVFEKKIIVEAISTSQNNKSKAMRLLGLSRRTFYRKLQEYDIK
jgi:PAS domain S-box-containing protein